LFILAGYLSGKCTQRKLLDDGITNISQKPSICLALLVEWPSFYLAGFHFISLTTFMAFFITFISKTIIFLEIGAIWFSSYYKILIG
jgi:hypothetical protein